MGRIISINWHKVSELAKTFYEEAENLKKIIDESKKAFESTSNSWKGIDDENFIANSDICISELNSEYLYMLEWSKYLTKASLRYSDNMEEARKRLQIIDDILNGDNNYGM